MSSVGTTEPSGPADGTTFLKQNSSSSKWAYVNVLEQYAKLARQGVRGENAASIRAEVERNAASIATAFENQLDALYAAESMDLSADLTVLQNMMKGQGLS